MICLTKNPNAIPNLNAIRNVISNPNDMPNQKLKCYTKP